MPLREMGRDQIWMLPPTLDEFLVAAGPSGAIRGRVR